MAAKVLTIQEALKKSRAKRKTQQKPQNNNTQGDK